MSGVTRLVLKWIGATGAVVGVLAALAVAGAAPAALGAGSTARTSARGFVLAAGRPVVRSRVTLWAASRAGAMRLGSAITSRKGAFRLAFRPARTSDVLYLTASSPAPASHPGVLLVSVLPARTALRRPLRIDERTTIAGLFATAQFVHGARIYGPAPGLPNAAATTANLIDPETARTGAVLAGPLNGTSTTTLATLDTLADAVAGCFDGADPGCRKLLAAARPSGAPAPASLLAAVADIARNPTNHVGAIFALATPSVYAPRLSQAPSAWTLSLLYGRGGFDGPGRIAFDSRGRIWVTNNFQPPGTGPGLGLISLSPSGQPINGSPVHGGGLQGAWWGIAIDQRDRVWVSSFVGSDTDASFSAPTFQGGHAVSLFSPGGAALSPSGGFSQGGIRAPQGIAVDQHGNVWIANHGNSTVTEYPHGDPSRAKVITGGGLSKPFAIEVDAHGNVWVGDNALTTLPGGLTEIDQSGHATGPIAGPLASPQGIAIDHEGYIWVTQSGRSTVARINPAAAHPVAQNFPANSLNGTWGIAVDGEDNVWATSFFGQTLTEFCGTERRHCPSGAQTGTQISPAKTGFSNGGLEHLTSVQVDQSGDVWVANNWRTITPPTGGDGLVEFIGLAGPVRTPLIGPPQAP